MDFGTGLANFGQSIAQGIYMRQMRQDKISEYDQMLDFLHTMPVPGTGGAPMTSTQDIAGFKTTKTQESKPQFMIPDDVYQRLKMYTGAQKAAGAGHLMGMVETMARLGLSMQGARREEEAAQRAQALFPGQLAAQQTSAEIAKQNLEQEKAQTQTAAELAKAGVVSGPGGHYWKKGPSGELEPYISPTQEQQITSSEAREKRADIKEQLSALEDQYKSGVQEFESAGIYNPADVLDPSRVKITERAGGFLGIGDRPKTWEEATKLDVSTVNKKGVPKTSTISKDRFSELQQKARDLQGVATELDKLRKAVATGGTTKELSAQDKQALQWAKDNPSDPRAADILKRLGL